MLASHMKSHSRVNRYRCAECSFSTKFSNALKRHLLAKDHEYGIVLNDDGSLPPEGPQRFYPNSASARRRRGAAGSGTSNRNRKSPNPVAGNVGVPSDELPTNTSTPQRTHVSPESGHSVKDADVSTYGGSMTSPEGGVRPSVIVKLEEGRCDEEESFAAEQVENSAKSMHPAPAADRAADIGEKSSPPRRYRGDETGTSMAYFVERLRCLVCGYPANGMADMTHHLMTSHGLASGASGGVGEQAFRQSSLESPSKKPRLDASGRWNDYRPSNNGAADHNEEDFRYSLSQFAGINRAIPQLEVDMSREFHRRQRHQQEQQQQMLAMWSGMNGGGSSNNRFPFVDSMEPTSKNTYSRRSYDDELAPPPPTASLRRHNDIERRRSPGAEMTSPYGGIPIRSKSSVAPPPVHNTSSEDHSVESAPPSGPLDLSSKPFNSLISDRGIVFEMSTTHVTAAQSGSRHLPRLDAFDEKYPASSSSPATTKKSRRKGRAFKLDPSLLLNDSVDEPLADEFVLGTTLSKTNEQANDAREPRSQMTSQLPETNGSGQRMNPPKKNPALRPVSTEFVSSDTVTKSCSSNDGDGNSNAATRPAERQSTANGNTAASMTDLAECPYCGLGFRDKTLHAMHMEFHDRRPGSDPFRCNLCGQQTADQLEFFVHIARAPHSTTKMAATVAPIVVAHSVAGAPSSAILGRLVPAMS